MNWTLGRALPPFRKPIKAQGILLILSLPDSGQHGELRGRVTDQYDYKGESGLENVKEFLEYCLEDDKYDEDDKEEEEERDDYEIDNEFFVPCDYPSDEEEGKDEDKKDDDDDNDDDPGEIRACL